MTHHEWLGIERGDQCLYELAGAKNDDERRAIADKLIMRYQIEAASDGLTKRQQKSIALSIRIMAAYVAAMMDNNEFRSAWHFMAVLAGQRVREGMMTADEAMEQLGKLR